MSVQLPLWELPGRRQNLRQIAGVFAQSACYTPSPFCTHAQGLDWVCEPAIAKFTAVNLANVTWPAHIRHLHRTSLSQDACKSVLMAAG
jgi:hypothetical protein